MTLLELNHAQATFVDEFFGDNILFYSTFDSGNDRVRFAGQQQDVNAGQQSLDFHIPLESVLFAYSFHFHTIRDNQAVIAKFFFEKLGNNGVGE